MRVRLFVLLTLGLVPLAALAQLYSWKDASGKTHYGDQPPAGKKEAARALRVSPPPEDAANQRKAFLERQMAERERQQKANEEASKQADSPVAPIPPPTEPR